MGKGAWGARRGLKIGGDDLKAGQPGLRYDYRTYGSDQPAGAAAKYLRGKNVAHWGGSSGLPGLV